MYANFEGRQGFENKTLVIFTSMIFNLKKKEQWPFPPSISS
jgi:hypothetical protein